MRRLLLCSWTVALWLATSTTSAQTGNNDVQACVAASTAGQTQRDEGHLIAAQRELRACARESCPGIVEKRCLEWLADVNERLPSIIVRVQDAGAQDVFDVHVKVDGEPIVLDGRPVTLDPGQHEVVVEREGRPTAKRKILLAEREQARLVSIALGTVAKPAASTLPPPPPPAQQAAESKQPARFHVPWGVWVLTGVGVGALTSFVVVGLGAKRDRDDLWKICMSHCNVDQPDMLQRAKHKALAADISLGVGAAALVGAGAWTLTSWLRGRKAGFDHASLTFGPLPDGVLAGYRTAY